MKRPSKPLDLRQLLDQREFTSSDDPVQPTTSGLRQHLVGSVEHCKLRATDEGQVTSGLV
ncbi:MAG TPA: hypothetical protein VFS21_07260 [Roseiflexaceae bacterium]|nr:hypothetical protein [Roseiflexaceae bacterium]